MMHRSIVRWQGRRIIIRLSIQPVEGIKSELVARVERRERSGELWWRSPGREGIGCLDAGKDHRWTTWECRMCRGCLSGIAWTATDDLSRKKHRPRGKVQHRARWKVQRPFPFVLEPLVDHWRAEGLKMLVHLCMRV